jgi:type 1 glutamine amidotransferase
MKKEVGTLIIFLTFALVLFNACDDPPRFNALVVSDAKEEANEALDEILEGTGLFDVDFENGNDPDFGSYDVVVLMLNESKWPDKLNDSFESYLTSGGGMVLLGASPNAFNDQPGLGGLLGIAKGEKLQKSNDAYDYQVVNSSEEHPILDGLQLRWMHGSDYMLYGASLLVEDATVLATAKADSTHGGNNQVVPMLYSVSAGQGRVFGSLLGYGAMAEQIEALQCVGLITMVQRGAEWAATGAVSQQVPVDFPNSVSTHFWPDYKPLSVDELMDKMASYQVGKSRKYLADFSARIRNSDGQVDTYADFEAEMIEFLQSEATVDSKRFVCRELSWMGSEASIEVLEQLAEDPELSEAASYALQRLRP